MEQKIVEGIFTEEGIKLIQEAITTDKATTEPDYDDIVVLVGVLHRRANYNNYDDDKLKSMIIDYKQKMLSKFDTMILDMFYVADSINQARLYLAVNVHGEAFFRYGRENVNVLLLKD